MKDLYAKWPLSKADAEHRQSIIDWRDAAIADGWTTEPTFKNEDGDRASKLFRDGFQAQAVVRDLDGRESRTATKAYYSLVAWGPDKLSIEVSRPYSWDAIVDAVTRCQFCDYRGKTVRLAFCNRVCPDCREKKKAEYEAPGWCN